MESGEHLRADRDAHQASIVDAQPCSVVEMLDITSPESRSDIRFVRSMRPRPPLPLAPFLVLGLGRAGRAAAKALGQAAGPQMVRVWDASTSASMQRLRGELEAAGIRTQLGPRLTRQEVGWARTVVKSPGIAFDAPAIRCAVADQSEVIDELELGWRLSRAPILAVTGTNGKSTVSGLLTSILSAAGQRVQLAGNTQFGPCLSAVASGSLDWIVCEASSFQLEGCSQMLPELAVFTNLTPEHLDRHGTLERYGAIKRRLFINDDSAVARAIIDVDGSFGRELARDIERRGGVVIRVGFSPMADYRVVSTTWDLRRAATLVRTRAERISITTSLPGDYNARNAVAALAVADLMCVDRRISLQALRGYVGPPGRFEHIDAGQPFEVIVDFAHTPDALEQLLRTIRAGMKPKGRLIVVLGLGGPPSAAFQAMGRLAGQLSDRLFLTTSGFRGSPPVPALGSLLAGARMTSTELDVVLNRRRAIELATLSATADDVVVIPGRGAFRDMRADARGEPIPFDDREVAIGIVRDLVSSPRPQGRLAALRNGAARAAPGLQLSPA